MTWSVIISILLQIFGPFLVEALKKLFEKWFKKAEKNLTDVDPTNLPPEAAIGKLFDELLTVVPRRQIARRLMVKAMKRAAVYRAGEIMKGDIDQIPSFDQDELDELELTTTLAVKDQ